MCFGCSKEPSHRDGSFEYPQHMFWLRNKKKNSVTHSHSRGLNSSAFDLSSLMTPSPLRAVLTIFLLQPVRTKAHEIITLNNDIRRKLAYVYFGGCLGN